MKTIMTTVAATLFTASVSAADVYHGLDKGNPDLSGKSFARDIAGVQPSIGDSIDRYHGFSDGNPDLFQPFGPVESNAGRASADDGPIYVGPGLKL